MLGAHERGQHAHCQVPASGCRLGTVNQAEASDGTALRLSAEVQPFCRLQTSLGTEQLVTFQGREASLGSVREVCNVRGWYQVRASFTNLRQGVVLVGGEAVAIGPDGSAIFNSLEPAARLREWRLADADIRDAGQPVTVRLAMQPN